MDRLDAIEERLARQDERMDALFNHLARIDFQIQQKEPSKPTDCDIKNCHCDLHKLKDDKPSEFISIPRDVAKNWIRSCGLGTLGKNGDGKWQMVKAIKQQLG